MKFLNGLYSFLWAQLERFQNEDFFRLPIELGNVLSGGNFFTGGDGAAWSAPAGIDLHGIAGCVTGVASGAKCGPRALSAAFTKALAPTVAELTDHDPLSGAAVSAVVGGHCGRPGWRKICQRSCNRRFRLPVQRLSALAASAEVDSRTVSVDGLYRGGAGKSGD